MHYFGYALSTSRDNRRGFRKEFARTKVVDETHEPSPSRVEPTSYAWTKRTAEHLFSYSAMLSGGRWSAVIANPSDIIGPILSPHQAGETWQGKIGMVVSGVPAPQETGGRPYQYVDVRDVVEAPL